MVAAPVLDDIRFAIRSLRRSPRFAVLAVLMLAVGIGASTAVFATVDAVFLKPLPVIAPGQLRTLSWTSRKRPFARPQFGAYADAIIARGETLQTFPYSLFEALSDRAPGFSGLACSSGAGLRVVGDSGFFNALLVTGDYFRVAGIRVRTGRALLPADDRQGALVAVISDALWRRAFGGRPDILSQSIAIKGVRLRIVGVTAAGFAGLDPGLPHDVFVPYATRASLFGATPPFNPEAWSGCNLIGRLTRGGDDEQARVGTEALIHDFVRSRAAGEDYEPPRLYLTDISRGGDRLRQATAVPLAVLAAMVMAALLVACANIAGLLTARAEVRRREVATRVAVGASRARIVRQLMAESLVLSAVGGAAGAALSYAFSPLLPVLLRQLAEIPSGGAPSRHAPMDVTAAMDARVVAFTIAAVAIAAMAFGLLPALGSARRGLQAAMKPWGTTGAIDGLRLNAGTLLAGAQIAFTTAVLVGAGLLARSVINLWNVPIGYDPNQMLYVTVDAVRTREQAESLFRRLEALPDVSTAAISQWPLFTNAERQTHICVAGVPGSRDELVDSDRISEHYFAAWGTPLLAGRSFGPSRERSAIVNQTFARRFLPGNPIGQTIGFGACPGVPLTVVGLVADHTDRPRVNITPMVYVPSALTGPSEPTTYTLRTSGEVAALARAVARALSDSGRTVGGDITTGIEYRDRTLTQLRALSAAVVLFGALTLVVSSLGLYGLLSLAVQRRQPEIGLRLALGAQTRHLLAAITGRALACAIAGIAAGLIVAALAGRQLQSLLFAVTPADPAILGAAALLVLLTALIAAAGPVLRARQIDPVEALRRE